MPQMNMVQALNDALRLAMRRDDRIVVLGEDVGRAGGVFRVTAGLWEAFGEQRVIDTKGLLLAAMADPDPRFTRPGREERH